MFQCIYKHKAYFTAFRKFTIWNGDDDNGSDFGGGYKNNGGVDGDGDDDDGQEREKEKKALFMVDMKAKLELTASSPCSLVM